MFLMLSRILSRSNCILISVIFNLASSAPLKSQKHSSFQSDQGFSASPKVLEIQLPLKIATKNDLAAWSKYVMSLMASKINFAPLKNPLASNSIGLKSKEMTKKAPHNEKRQGVNYPARRLKEPPVQRADDMVVAYPLPMGAMGMTTSSPLQDASGHSTSNFDGSTTDFGQFMDFNIGNPFQQSEIDDTFGHFGFLSQPPPSNAYLPSSSRPMNAKSYQNAKKNVSGLAEEPAKLQSMRNSLNHRFKAHDNELGQQALSILNSGLPGANLSHIGEPLLAFPFQAVITIHKELPEAVTMTQPNDYAMVEDFPNGFPPYFGQNYAVMNESGGFSEFNEFNTDTSETKARGSVSKEKEEANKQKKQNQTKVKSTEKQQSLIKRQSSVLGDLLRMLGVLRKLPKNSTEVNVATPILSILKGTNAQKIQVAFDETPPHRERRNETFLAQQINDDDDDENGGNDEESQEQEESEDQEEEGEGGSIQNLIDLLPLAAPLLEDLSDPESDVDIAEVLQSAIPLLQGLSDPNEEGGVDIPAVLLPLLQRLSQGGPEGSGAILGPIIQLVAPLIGPLSGPLIGPLSSTFSGPGGAGGSASIFAASSEPLSKPMGKYGQSVLSGLIASITARLSKELAASAGDSDVKSLVSSVVSGVLAGTSSGISTASKHKNYGSNTYGSNTYGSNTYGNRDTYQSSGTSYGTSYGKPQKPSSDSGDILEPVLQIFGSILKLAASVVTSGSSTSGSLSSTSTGLSGSLSESSKEPEKPTYGSHYGAPAYGSHYGAPAHGSHYGAPTSPPYATRPPYAAPPSTSSSYASYTRRQVAEKIKKF